MANEGHLAKLKEEFGEHNTIFCCHTGHTLIEQVLCLASRALWSRAIRIMSRNAVFVLQTQDKASLEKVEELKSRVLIKGRPQKRPL